MDDFKPLGEEESTDQLNSRRDSTAWNPESTVPLRIDGIRHVEKGSLTESALVEAKIRAKRVRNRDEMTEEERWTEKRAANRLAAFQSRQRRKIIIDDLQNTVAKLIKDNSDQSLRIKNLESELASLRQANELLHSHLHQIDQSHSQLLASLCADQQGLTGVIAEILSGATKLSISNQNEIIALLGELAVILKHLAFVRLNVPGVNHHTRQLLNMSPEDRQLLVQFLLRSAIGNAG